MAKTPAAKTPVPCKITGDALTGFQVKSTDMPVDFKLVSPDNKTELTGVDVFPAGTATAVAGQPTNLSGASFTLKLPVGTYHVGVAIAALPSAQPIVVTEACSAAPVLEWLAGQVSQSGQFPLEVI